MNSSYYDQGLWKNFWKQDLQATVYSDNQYIGIQSKPKHTSKKQWNQKENE